MLCVFTTSPLNSLSMTGCIWKAGYHSLTQTFQCVDSKPNHGRHWGVHQPLLLLPSGVPSGHPSQRWWVPSTLKELSVMKSRMQRGPLESGCCTLGKCLICIGQHECVCSAQRSSSNWWGTGPLVRWGCQGGSRTVRLFYQRQEGFNWQGQSAILFCINQLYWRLYIVTKNSSTQQIFHGLPYNSCPCFMWLRVMWLSSGIEALTSYYCLCSFSSFSLWP